MIMTQPHLKFSYISYLATLVTMGTGDSSPQKQKERNLGNIAGLVSSANHYYLLLSATFRALQAREITEKHGKYLHNKWRSLSWPTDCHCFIAT